MKRKFKFLGMIVTMFILCVIFSKNNAYAYLTKGDQFGSTNLITLPWHPGTPNLYWHFYFSDTGQTVFCVEPHVVFNGGHQYSSLGKYSGDVGRQISYVYDNPPAGLSWEEGMQIRQAVIWALNGDYDIYSLDRKNGYVNIAISLYEAAKANANGADINNQMSTQSLTFNLEGTNWVSNWVYIKGGASVSNNIGSLQRDGDNWRVVVPDSAISGSTTVQIYSSMSTVRYNEADMFGGPNNKSSHGQNVVISGGSYTDSRGETATGYINPVGNLVVEKKDNYGTYRSGATFTVSGPGGSWTVTTDGNGKAYLNGILKGTYTITETQAPSNMKNEESGRTVSVAVNSGSTTTYTRQNGYPRGSVRLVKYDADHRGATLGDATLAGAKFNLCAAADIYEGATKIYSKDQVIATVTTDAAGNTPAVTNLPIGNYYYKEIQASTGFLLNGNAVNVSVTYGGQYVYTIGEKSVEISEKPIYGNVEITKKLGALDYDTEINLKDAQFKATLNSDPTQVYYSTKSDANGIATFTNIPYGTYTIEECVVPAAAEKIANFEVVILENGKTYKSTKVDTSKDMKIEINKHLVVVNNWKTDAKVEGSYFTVYRDAACTDKVCVIGPTDANGYAISQGAMRTGTYYLKETTFPEGINPDATVPGENVTYKNKVYSVTYDNTKQGTEQVIVTLDVNNEPKYSTINIDKRLGALDYDVEIDLVGAQFKATLKSDRTQVHYSNVSGLDGICKFENLPYGIYEIEESIVPPEAEKIDIFDVSIIEHGITYDYTKVDTSKDMKIEIFKEILVADGEATDAVVEGAEFTVYRDADCTNKVCVIGPTDKTGYAISGTMRTGTYYIKETVFPEGIDPDATIPGEDVTYRNKVYSVTYDNTKQGTELVTVSLTVQNEPKRHDIEIYKEIGKTSNTAQAPLDKCEFTATLKSTIGTDNVFSRKCTAETDANGYCIIEDLPYGDYVVEETKVSPISLKCDNFDINIKEDQKVQAEPYSKNIVDTPKVMQIKMRKVDANRKDTDAPDFTQGDGVLEGAIYQIYRYDPQTDDYTEAVYEITVDHKDSEEYWCAESKDLLVGKYMVKEKISYTEVVDGKTINYSYAEGYLADPETYYFEQQPDLQTVERTYHYNTSKEEVIRGSVEVIKYDDVLNSSDEVASEGAILRLTLDSNPEKYYDAVINEYGYAEFVEEESREQYYPNTIPYGKYTITEVKESNKEEHTSFFVQPEDVVIRKQVQKEYRIEADEPVEMYLQVQKTDKDTGANVKIAGAKFKVWNCETGKWVSQMVYPSGNYIDVFETNEEGNLTLPHKLEAGDYIVYEIQAPEGYYLEEAWRIPENQKDIGNADKGGKYLRIDKAAMGVIENTPANRLDLYYMVEMPNEPLKGKLEIFKTGEVLTDSSIDSTEYGEKYTPVYNLRGLAGVTYDIYAAEDIKSPDGLVTYVEKGTKVDTITTGEDGYATTTELYLGEYEIKEVVTPVGYLTDENIENVTLENTDTLKRIEVTEKSLTDVRQKLKLTFNKAYDEVNFVNGKEYVKYSVFGVYANQNIKNVDGTIVINKDDLVDIIRIEGEETNATSTIDLPEGKYYVQELDASYPYSISEEIKEVELTYSGNKDEYITYSMEGFTNTYLSASLSLVKVSTSTINDLVLEGQQIKDSELDAQLTELLETLKGLTASETAEYLKNTNVKVVPGATYKMYIDKECTQPLYLKSGEEFVEAELVTDDAGMITLENIPLGKYYLIETKAPTGYKLSEEVITVVLTREDKDAMVYRALTDSSVQANVITKVDIFTGEVIPNCTFEIRDEEDNLLLKSITDEEGNAYIPVDLFEDGKTYTYTETDAPEIYNLNKEPHEFVAKFDEEGKWATEKILVENLRKESTVIFEKLDFADSTPIPNCKFELRSLETDFVVEGVTDENGIYVFENIPYGKYTYTELEAPEEYIIDTEAHEVTIDAEEMKLQITNEKAPETGDIQVVTLAVISVISIAGIAFILKNKKRLVK